MSDMSLRPVRPDDQDWIVDRHAALYARDEGFDGTFGPLVRGIVADFLAGHDPRREAGWIAEGPQGRIGCIFCMRKDDETAKLRLFLILPEARGKGRGRQLLAACMGFAREAGYRRMVLWTHASHEAACALYARSGWHLADSHPVRSFGVDLIEQAWEIDL